MRLRCAVGLLVIGLLLTGCSGFVDSDQASVDPEAMLRLESGGSIGQTFVARHGGLGGMDLWLAAEDGVEGELILHLVAAPDPESGVELARAMVSAEQIASRTYQRFSFDPLQDAHGQSYYAWVEFQGSGAVYVGRADGQAYLDGSAYLDHQPLDSQLAFRLVYAPALVALDLIGAAFQGAGVLIAAVLLYIVPGWALLAWLWPRSSLTWPERLALAVGLSLSLYPLLLLWAQFAGLSLGAFNAWIPVGGGLIALVWRYRSWRPRQGWDALRSWRRSSAVWPDTVLLVVLGLIFGVRLLVVRTLDVPMWGDSYQHTMVAQLLVDHGGLFSSWAPYEPYRTLTVHVGFHTTVAAYMWLTGASSIQATMLVGQLLNGFAVLTIYPLAVRTAEKQRWAGVAAVAAAGLLSTMPAYFVNWGRYAQLAGQVILPVVVWCLWEAAENPNSSKGAVALGGMALAGMTLSYYRMPFYLLAYIGPWFLFWSWDHIRSARPGWWRALLRCFLTGVFAVLLFLPWFGKLEGSPLATGMERGLTAQTSWGLIRAEYQIWRDLDFYVPTVLVAITVLTLGWAGAMRSWKPLSMGVWILVLSVLVLGRMINFPGANYMQNFAVFIAFYIPVGCLVGWWAVQVKEQLSKLRVSHVEILMAGVVLGASVLGAQNQVSIVDPRFALVSRPDIHAMEWIRQNVAANARFLVEGFRVYEGNSAVGADAGWWIPLFTLRANTMPPQYALFNEQSEPPDYTRRVVELVAALEGASPSSSEGLALFCREGITHVYIGQGQGQVGTGAIQLFAPSDFLDRPEFRLIYHEDRVYIFAVDEDVCIDVDP